MIPYSHQLIDKRDIEAVIKVLRSDWLTQGPKVKGFENAISEYVGSRYAVVFSSGTAALQAAYFAAGFKKGDEFIVPPLTFAATSNAGIWQGAKPVFADIKNNTGNIDPAEVEKKITKKTKAIVAVDYGGLPADLEELKKIAKKKKIILIEDAAHSFGASYKGKKIGGIADMTMFSFHPVKTITTGEGGAIVTSRRDFYEKLLLFRNHGITKERKKFLNKSSGDWYMEMQELGLNYRLTDIQAALGLSQLKKIDKFIRLRKKITERYQKELSGIPGIILPTEEKNKKSSWHLYPIRLGDELADKRDAIFKQLREAGIGVHVHYLPVYWHPYYRKLGYKKGLCPNAEAWHRSVISFPIYPSLKKTDQEKIIRVFKNILKRNGLINLIAPKNREKVLITGSRGLLGSYLLKYLNENGFQAVPFDADIRDKKALKKFSNLRFDWIIHTAAITDVDLCEKDKQLCYDVNVLGTGNIVSLARAMNARIIYISTTSVFPGLRGNYKESDIPHPNNFYNVSKLLGEKIVYGYERSLILRLNLIGVHILGSRGKNFFEWLIDSIRNNKDIRLFKDVLINPLSNITTAEIIRRLMFSKIDDKILHIGSSTIISKADIGKMVIKKIGNYKGRVKYVSINNVFKSASRPKKIFLNTDVIQKKYSIKMPTLESEIGKILENNYV